MVPMALIGPATSGFTTASIMQSAATTTANYVVKKKTGKTFGQHALDTINNNSQRALGEITTESLKQTYLPQNNKSFLEIPK